MTLGNAWPFQPDDKRVEEAKLIRFCQGRAGAAELKRTCLGLLASNKTACINAARDETKWGGIPMTDEELEKAESFTESFTAAQKRGEAYVKVLKQRPGQHVVVSSEYGVSGKLGIGAYTIQRNQMSDERRKQYMENGGVITSREMEQLVESLKGANIHLRHMLQWTSSEARAYYDAMQLEIAAESDKRALYNRGISRIALLCQ